MSACYRHWVDPTVPFAASGRGAGARRGHDLGDADRRQRASGSGLGGGGGAHRRAASAEAGDARAVPSPFDYPAQTRVFVVTDLGKNDLDQVAAAYRELFLAAGGGALGLFTAIARLREVHRRIAPALEADGARSAGPACRRAWRPRRWSTSSAREEDACLLGTDAVRDGVDVPGRSLRLIVFDRVPWPRPDILHRGAARAFRRHGL